MENKIIEINSHINSDRYELENNRKLTERYWSLTAYLLMYENVVFLVIQEILKKIRKRSCEFWLEYQNHNEQWEAIRLSLIILCFNEIIDVRKKERQRELKTRLENGVLSDTALNKLNELQDDLETLTAEIQFIQVTAALS